MYGWFNHGRRLHPCCDTLPRLATAPCQSTWEPGCAVDAAIEAGELESGGRDGLHKLARELAAAELRRDPLAAREPRARVKAVNKALRARGRVDPKLRR